MMRISQTWEGSKGQMLQGEEPGERSKCGKMFAVFKGWKEG